MKATLLALTLAWLPAAVAAPAPESSDFAVSERSRDSRTWKRTEWEVTPSGYRIPHEHKLIELGTGICYQREGAGPWLDTSETIQVLPSGMGAAATNGAHNVFFPPDIYTGAIQVVGSDGRVQRCRPMAITYFDGANNALIAGLTNSPGQILPSGNQVIYTNCFCGLAADLLVTYRKSGIECDLVFRQQPPEPAQFSLDPDTCRIQLLTEFFGTEDPQPRLGPLDAADGLVDSTFEFGSLRMVPGRAFSIPRAQSWSVGRPAARAAALLKERVAARVYKSWLKVQNRTFLLEELPYRKLQPLLAELAAADKPSGPPLAGSGPRWRSSGSAILLPSRPVEPARAPLLLARSALEQHPGVILDFVEVAGSANSFVFQADSTYLVSSLFAINGEVFFQGNTVIKFASDVGSWPALLLYGPMDSSSSDFRPIFFTSSDDNSVGEQIGTGDPQVSNAFCIETYGPFGSGHLAHARIAYASAGFLAVNTSDVSLEHCQFLHCAGAAIAVGGNIFVGNTLFSDCGYAVSATTGLVSAQNVTADGCAVFCHSDGNLLGLALTNCLFTGGGGLTDASITPSVDHSAVLASASGVFSSAAGGSYYLADASTNRLAGTTNIDSGLLADLKRLTTYSPRLWLNTEIPVETTFAPQAQRDPAFPGPDLGYHYPPIDHLFAGADAASNVTFAAGTVAAWYPDSCPSEHFCGLHLLDSVTANFDGRAEAPTYWIRNNLVQEQDPPHYWCPGGITGSAYPDFAQAPLITGRFLRASMPAGETTHFRDDFGYLRIHLAHSEFWTGSLGGYASQLHFINCLFDAVNSFWTWDDGTSSMECDLHLQSCLFQAGVFIPQRFGPDPNGRYDQWLIHDTAFDATQLLVDDAALGDTNWTACDYNAFLTTADRFSPPGAHDVLVTNFNWQSCCLGNNYYLPTDSPLINAGSAAASALGLYHFTTQTDQTKETNSIVDISYHYPALGATGAPVDTDGGGVPDYLENLAGDGGTSNPGESSWLDPSDDNIYQAYPYLLTPSYLRCEYRENPWGVDTRDPQSGINSLRPPRLYWILNSDRRAAKQSAYQILVASSPDYLNSNYGDMWDSGRVNSDQTIHIEYGSSGSPQPLQSNQRLWWKVRTWDACTGLPSPWSTNGFFQIGLINASDWKAAWLTTPQDPGQGVSPIYRKEFVQRTNEIKRATAYVTARGVYELWVNGSRVGDHILAPEWTDYNKRYQYQAFDVTTNLICANTDGTNHVVGAVVAEGWFSGTISTNYYNHGIYTGYSHGPKQLLLQIIVEKNDGTTNTVVTDDSWSWSAAGPIKATSIYDGETYDARAEPAVANWCTLAYTQALSYFQTTVATNALDPTQLVGQPDDPIRIVQYLAPVDMWLLSSNATTAVWIYDMGQNMVGWSSLSLLNTNQLAGETITLEHAEQLRLVGGNPVVHADIDTNSLTSYVRLVRFGEAAQQKETYILGGPSTILFSPHFTYHGFRYVRVAAPSRLTLTTNSLLGCVIHNNARITGAFTCSDTRVSKLMTNILWTQRGNTFGVPTDCPQRQERFGWMGDMQMFAQTACLNMDMAAFYTKHLRDSRDEQSWPGIQPGEYTLYAPWTEIGTGDLGWEATPALMPWTIYRNYADLRVLAEHYTSMSNWLAFLDRRFGGHIVPVSDPLMNAANAQNIDSANMNGFPWTPVGHSDVNTSLYETAYYIASADSAANVSLALSRVSSDPVYLSNYSYYSGLAASLRAQVQTSPSLVSYDGSGHVNRVGNDSQTDYTLALYFDLVAAPNRPDCAKLLVTGQSGGITNFNRDNEGDHPPVHLSTGFVGSGRMMLELTDSGSNSVAYALLLKTNFPSWLYGVTHGETTTTEKWNALVQGVSPGYYQGLPGDSFSHYVLGSVGEWVWRNVVGIYPDDGNPGFGNVIINPQIGGGVTSSSGSYESIRGRIACSWTTVQTDNPTNTYVITVPANGTATLYLPFTNLANVTESGLPATNAVGVLSSTVLGQASVFRLGSGAYRFAASQ